MTDTDPQITPLWIARQKLTFLKAYAAEQVSMHDRIMARFVTLLPLYATLATASIGGAFAKPSLEVVCGCMALGFSAAGLLCIKGFHARNWESINLTPAETDRLLGNAETARARTETETLQLFIKEYEGRLQENEKILARSRTILKWTLRLLISTPIAGGVLAFVLRLVVG
ncbi:hypothetical protein E3E11_06750 [Oecophyllibacter saccharovorans]|uniref:hypothetical protein n=1 Tax=Oecophyllibacter saccharovorans TaxID=2558360 RepID=UPI00114440DB|nr:hypothetical protein [Oecophyllibacter saccharovorans]QDH15604.1 hypothetical protein E3E11_06750 [Oecophyllibacter saccharovorans]